MSNAQEHAAENPSNGTLSNSERTRLRDELVDFRHTIIDSRTSRVALIIGVIAFLLTGKLGLTVAMVLGLIAGAIAYAAKKVSLQKKLLPSITNYDDERLRHWHTQALLELVAAQKRSAIVRGTFVLIVVVLIIVRIVARVQQ